MASRYSVETIFSAIDKVSAPVRRMGMSVNSFSKSVGKDFRAAQMRVDRMGSALGGLGGFLTAGAILSFANQAIDAFNQSAAAVANVEAGIKATNNQLGISSEQFQDMAKNWQKVTIFEDDAILQNVTAQLQTFSNITATNFDRVQKASLDVTSKLKGINATGEDLKSTSIMLGKAMNDPARGMGALRRVGIQFDAQVENTIKTLQRQGRMGEAQALMLQEIEKQYGGAAEAIAKTDGGLQKIKMNEIGDRMEEIGKNLIPIKSVLLSIVSTVLKPLTVFLDFIINNPIGQMILSAAIAWKAYSVAMTLAAVAQKLFNNLQTTGISKVQLIIAVIGALVGIVLYLRNNWDKFSTTQKTVIVVLGTLIGIIGTIISVMKAWRSIQIALNIAMSANPIGLIILAIAMVIVYIVLLIKYWDKMSTGFKVFAFIVALIMGPLYAMIFIIILISKTIKKHFAKIKEFLQPAIDAFMQMFEEIKAALMPLVDVFKELFGAIFDAIGFVFDTLGSILVSFFPQLEGFFEGGSFLDTLVSGIKTATSIIVAIIRFTTQIISGMIGVITAGIEGIKTGAGKVLDFFGIDRENAKPENVATQRSANGKMAQQKGATNEVIIRNDSNSAVENKGSRVGRGQSLNMRYSG